jgi:hypothetical protein
MDIEKALKSDRLMRALTGLNIIAFKELAKLFSNELYISKKDKKDRVRAVGGGRKGKLSSDEHKLFYLLFYFKVYPTFDMASFVFGVHRSRAHEWVQRLQSILEKCLGKAMVLPKRQISTPEELFEVAPGIKDLFIDGVERKALRAKKPKAAARRYSGKKKMHTRKNIVGCDEKRRIIFLSKSKNGKFHDKKMVDKSLLPNVLPKSITLWVDKGFRGIHKICKSKVMMPKFSSKKNPLTQEEKQENAIISGIRMTVEHAINGIKRFGIMANPFRNKNGKDDKFTELCAGLWNWHLRCAG